MNNLDITRLCYIGFGIGFKYIRVSESIVYNMLIIIMIIVDCRPVDPGSSVGTS